MNFKNCAHTQTTCISFFLPFFLWDCFKADRQTRRRRKRFADSDKIRSFWYIYIYQFLSHVLVSTWKKEWECAYITKTKVAFSMLIMNYHTQFFSFDYRAFFFKSIHISFFKQNKKNNYHNYNRFVSLYFIQVSYKCFH